MKVVLGSLNQQRLEFCGVNGETVSDSLTFLLHRANVPEKKISKSMIDAVLRVGDRVHAKLSEALDSPRLLSLEEKKAANQTLGEHQVIFPQAIFTGDVFSSIDFPFVTLEKGLHIAVHTNTGALLRIMEYTIAMKKLPDGCFAVFDPHARNCNGFVDGNGCAIYMELISSLVAVIAYVRKFVRHKGYEKRAPVSEEGL